MKQKTVKFRRAVRYEYHVWNGEKYLDGKPVIITFTNRHDARVFYRLCLARQTRESK